MTAHLSCHMPPLKGLDGSTERGSGLKFGWSLFQFVVVVVVVVVVVMLLLVVVVVVVVVVIVVVVVVHSKSFLLNSNLNFNLMLI